MIIGYLDLQPQRQKQKSTVKWTRKQFTCYECNKIFLNQGCLWSHKRNECDAWKFQRKIYMKKLYLRPGLCKESLRQCQRHVCPKCGRSYKAKSSVSRHLKLECDKMPQYKCTICKREFHQIDNCKRHVKSVHHEDITKDYIEFSVSLQSRIASAMKKNSKHSVQYSMPDYYKRLGRHFCSACGKEYRWMQSLIRHKREECGKDPQHTCSVCGIRIRHKWMLKKHLVNVHFWDFRNDYKASKQRYEKYHWQYRDFIEQKHEEYHGQNRGKYSCNVCERKYKWRSSLWRHKREECGKERQCLCPLCGKKFVHKHHLKHHYETQHMQTSRRKLHKSNP
nr:PREDICTED: zinc finger protein 677-like [Linepithema humile]